MITRIGLVNTDIADPPLRSEVEFCKRWIGRNCQKSRHYNYDYSSYGLKHMVEMDSTKEGNYRGSHYFYVSNGAFIQAAVELGYKYKPVSRRETRVHFNFKIPEELEEHDNREIDGNWTYEQMGKNMQIHWKLREREPTE